MTDQPAEDNPPSQLPAGPAAEKPAPLAWPRARQLELFEPSGAAVSPEAPADTAAPRPHRRGHPGHRARNDVLLALFEATPAHLPHLQRCRVAARMLADEQASIAQLNPAAVAPLADTTARDAIAEALAHRAASGPRTKP